MGADWQRDFQLSPFQLSCLASGFFYAYVIVQILAGFLYDYWGAKRVVRLSTFCFSGGLLLFAGSHNFYLAFLGRFLMGLSAGFAFVGMVYVAASWFKMQFFIIFVALGELLSMSLTALGQYLAAPWVLEYGWRSVIVGLAILAFLLFLAVTFWLANPPEFRPQIKPFLKTLGQDLWTVIKIPQIWLAGIFCAGMFGVITVFASLWGSFFLEQAYGLPYLDSARMIALVPLGIAVGGPLFGFLNERVNTIYLIRLVSLSLFLLVLVILFWTKNTLILSISLFGMGFLGGTNILAFYIVERNVEASIRGISVGFCNALAILCGTVFQAIIGFLYSHGSVVQAMFPFAGLILCAFFATILLGQIT